MVREVTPKTVYWLGDRLYLNITNQCTNDCVFCIRRFWPGVGGFNLRLTVEPEPSRIVSELMQVLNMRNWREVVFCGFGEPTARLNCLVDLTRWIRMHYHKPLCIRVDTNGHGYVLNSDVAVVDELKHSGVDKVSVSLNAYSEETYREVCRPKFEGAYAATLNFINKAKEALPVEVTCVAAPEVDVQRIREVVSCLNVPFRVRAYIPGFL
jgi:TatD family-associated radical SAM protein